MMFPSHVLDGWMDGIMGSWIVCRVQFALPHSAVSTSSADDNEIP